MATVMYDLEADTTYVSHNFVIKTKHKLISSKYAFYSAFGNQKSQDSKEGNVYDLNVLDIEGNSHSMLAVEVMSICPPLRRQKLWRRTMNMTVISLWTYWLIFTIIGNLFQLFCDLSTQRSMNQYLVGFCPFHF